MGSAALSHNSKQDLSSGARRPQERRPARLSSVSLSLSNNSSLQRAGLCSAVLKRSSLRLEGRCLEVISSLHSLLVDCLGVRRPNNSQLRPGPCSGAPQINQPRAGLSLGATKPSQLRAAVCLVRNNPFNNSRADPFLAAHNNRPSSKEALSLVTPRNPPPDRRHRSLGQHNNPPPIPHCLVTPSSRKRESHCMEIPSPRSLAPPPP